MGTPCLPALSLKALDREAAGTDRPEPHGAEKAVGVVRAEAYLVAGAASPLVFTPAL